MSAAPRWAGWLAALAIVPLPLLPAGFARPPVSPPPFSLELELSAAGTLTPGLPPSTLWYLRAHLEGLLPAGAAVLRFSLDPAAWYDGTTHVTAGVTEAYLQLRHDSTIFSAGIERLPLEVARLTLPFSIEPVDALGVRGGLAGIRSIWYPDDATRLRLALVGFGGGVAPIVSLRRQFAAFEVEGHAAVLGGRTALGLGASGLLGRLVVYGEIWALTAPVDWRYSVGLSGSVKGGFWTVEAAYASVLPGLPPRRQVAAQLAQQLSDDLSWRLTVRAFPDPDAVRTQAGVEFTRTFAATELTLLLGGQFGPEPPQGLIRTVLRISF